MTNVRAACRGAVELAAVLAVAVYVEVALRRRRPLDQIASTLGVQLDLETRASEGVERAVLPGSARRQAREVERVLSVWPFGDTCLRRCLILGHRLRRLRPVLRVGVKLQDGRTAAHSWLEVDGRSIDGSGAGFTVMGVAP